MSPRSPAPLPSVVDDAARAAYVADVLKAVAHPLRLRIVALLSHRDADVGELVEALHAGQAIVSQQLRILRMAHLVAATRANGHAVYRLLEPQLRTLVACMDGCGVGPSASNELTAGGAPP